MKYLGYAANPDLAITSSMTSDQLIVYSEKTQQESKDAISLALTLEYQQRILFKRFAPDSHAYFNYVRLHWIDWLESAHKITVDYKNNRTAANEASLKSILSTLKSAQVELKKYTNQVNSATP